MKDDIRMIARTLASDLVHERELRALRVNAVFRLHRQWKATGFYGMPRAVETLDMLKAAFGPHDEDRDDRSFVRGARHVAGYGQDGKDGPAVEADVVAFWKVVSDLGAATGVEMPERTTPKLDDPIVLEERIEKGKHVDVKAANHSELRMALVFRADLDEMTRGKSEGQACHAGFESGVLLARSDPDLADRYLADGQPKIVLEIPDIEGLHKVVAKAHKRGVRVLAITDLGRTCFDGPTMTCALIGPMSKTDSNAITRGTELRDPPPPKEEDA
jgi:peptidyl-tRNA hydrolase